MLSFHRVRVGAGRVGCQQPVSVEPACHNTYTEGAKRPFKEVSLLDELLDQSKSSQRGGLRALIREIRPAHLFLERRPVLPTAFGTGGS